MGFLDKLKNVFNELFGRTPRIQFDDAEILISLRNIPPSLAETEYYKKAIVEIVENVHHVYTTANNKELAIGVIGDFTVGKSSFINAILGGRILPVSANPSTAVVTKIKYGRKPKVVVRYINGNELEMSYEDFMRFSAFNLDDFQERMDTDFIQRFKDVVDAVVFVKSEFLKANNLCIVDTLGLSAYESDNKRTIRSIRDAVSVIYMCGERGLSVKDVDFISNYLSPDKDDFFLCINRIDLVKTSEREKLSWLTKLKIDDILCRTGHMKKFPLSKIYQVSSLYQEFANGFTDHEDYHKDVNYQERSGFLLVMSDLCRYVAMNANVLKRESINKQLHVTQVQMIELMTLRENELNNISINVESKILELKGKIQEYSKRIAYINALFEGLYYKICDLSQKMYGEFCQIVESDWRIKLNSSLVKMISFGFGDYLALKRDLFVLELNVFKSMTDKRYAKLDSLSQFVELTKQFLKDKLQLVVDEFHVRILNEIETFVVSNSLVSFFDTKINFDCNILLSVEQNEVIFALYRSIALAGTESMWMKNKNRHIQMFNAAKEESLKILENPVRSRTEQLLNSIRKYLDLCNAKSIDADVKRVDSLTKQVKELIAQSSSLKKQMKEEMSYFKRVINQLNLTD